MKYEKPSYTADAVVLCGTGQNMKLLVVQRKNEPYRGKFALPGGFIESYEPSWQAVLRELQEETHLQLSMGEGVPLSIRERKGRDPRGWTVSIPYLYWIPDEVEVEGSDDAEKAQWILINELPELSFDHGAILCEALGKFWPFDFGNGPSLFKSIQGFAVPVAKEAEEWILYGGTFDPWHEGHEACVQAAKNYGKVIIVPDRNPFKDLPNRPCFLRFYHELRKKMGSDSRSVYPGLCGVERPVPTFQWWPSQSNKKNFSLLMGDDSFIQLPHWFHPDSLLSRVHSVYVMPRKHSAKKVKEIEEWAKTHNPVLKITLLPDHPYKEISSTKLRAERKI